MKLGKDIALMGLGAGALLMYQKYGAPIVHSMEKTMNKTMRKVEKNVDQMM